MNREMTMLGAGLASLAVCATAQAGQKISFDGTQYASGQFQSVQLEKNHYYSIALLSKTEYDDGPSRGVRSR
jgi:hypothetical protein